MTNIRFTWFSLSLIVWAIAGAFFALLVATEARPWTL